MPLLKDQYVKDLAAHSALRRSRFGLAEFALLFGVPVNLDHCREGTRFGSDLCSRLHDSIQGDFRLDYLGHRICRAHRHLEALLKQEALMQHLLIGGSELELSYGLCFGGCDSGCPRRILILKNSLMRSSRGCGRCRSAGSR